MLPTAAHSPKARRRQTPPPSEAESAKRALCAAIFDHPAHITDALSHEITERFEIQPHHHEDLLQLDLIDGCEGEVLVADRYVPIRGTTLLVTYPADRHGYTLLPGRPPSEVWLIKLRVTSLSKQLNNRPLPQMLTSMPLLETLGSAMQAFIQAWTPQGVRAATLAKLVQTICLWPASASEVNEEAHFAIGHHATASVSARIRNAVEKLGRHHHDPPNLEALAKAAHLSPRHFARRFRADFGCTPHDYMAARRLDAARNLLLRTEKQVNDVADELGFSSPAAFSRWFTHQTGSSPQRFRTDPHHF